MLKLKYFGGFESIFYFVIYWEEVTLSWEKSTHFPDCFLNNLQSACLYVPASECGRKQAEQTKSGRIRDFKLG